MWHMVLVHKSLFYHKLQKHSEKHQGKWNRLCHKNDYMLPLLVFFNVDDEKKIVLTRIKAKNGKTHKKENYHNSIITVFVMQWNINIIIEKNKVSIYFKDTQGIAKFEAMTSNNKILSSIFEANISVNIQTKHFFSKH